MYPPVPWSIIVQYCGGFVQYFVAGSCSIVAGSCSIVAVSASPVCVSRIAAVKAKGRGAVGCAVDAWSVDHPALKLQL